MLTIDVNRCQSEYTRVENFVEKFHSVTYYRQDRFPNIDENIFIRYRVKAYNISKKYLSDIRYTINNGPKHHKCKILADDAIQHIIDDVIVEYEKEVIR